MMRAIFEPYSVGPWRASVCTNLTDDEATARMNIEHQTGIISSWTIADEPFSGGAPNPTPCDDGRVGCRHMLFSC